MPNGSNRYEQFYSGDCVLEAMVRAIAEVIHDCDIYIDPSAGRGELFRAFPKKGLRLAFDIAPPRDKNKNYPKDVVRQSFQDSQDDIQIHIDTFQH